MKHPIFIFSMPRSGSTLLQRILSSHKLIGTSAEPWLLLPLVYSLKSEGSLTEYSNVNSSKAINDLVSTIKNGKHIYNKSIRDFANNIYSKSLIEKEIYFLDKTPRYYLIIDEIYEIFPEAKFIFLFRNPVHIYSSILKTWCGNNFLKLFGSHNDLTIGFKSLGERYNNYKDYKNTIGIRYEDFVSNPTKSIEKLLSFLEIEKDEKIEHNFIENDLKSDNKNFLGDPTGIHQYQSISQESLLKWKETFNTRIRKRIIKHYIKNTLTNNSFTYQGYDKEQILKEISQLTNNGNYNSIIDMVQYTGYKLVTKFNLYIFLGKKTSWKKNKFLS